MFVLRKGLLGDTLSSGLVAFEGLERAYTV